jgi:hypothetical protein
MLELIQELMWLDILFIIAASLLFLLLYNND